MDEGCLVEPSLMERHLAKMLTLHHAIIKLGVKEDHHGKTRESLQKSFHSLEEMIETSLLHTFVSSFKVHQVDKVSVFVTHTNDASTHKSHVSEEI